MKHPKHLDPQIGTIAQQLSENIRTLQMQAAPIALEIQRTAPIIQEIANSFIKKLIDVSPAIIQIGKALAELPEKYRKSLLIIAEHGWYFYDENMPVDFPMTLAKMVIDGESEKAEEVLEGYITSNLEPIESFLTAKFSNRKKILHAVFAAHRAEQYELSVPTLLAQVDGVCRDLTGYHLFMRAKGISKPQTSTYVEGFDQDLSDAILMAPLGENLSITKNQKERGEGFTQLNRHMIMHGESLDYGTRRNSLKAISLLNYAAQVLTPVEMSDASTYDQIPKE